MGKLLNYIISAIIVIAIILWLVKEITGIEPFMEQVGSSVKNIGSDFQKGFEDDIILDTMNIKKNEEK